MLDRYGADAKIRFAKHYFGQRPMRKIFAFHWGSRAMFNVSPINRTMLSPVLQRPPADFTSTRFRFERSLGDRR
jgi:hypothetical protein